MKKLTALLLMSTLALGVFAGCQSKEEPEDNNDTNEDTSLSYLIEKGEFVMGLDDAFPPMGFRDENNNIVGFDIDLAQAVSEKLDVELIVQPIDWQSKELELETKNIDCIWNGMSIDAARQEAMTMTGPYLNNEMVFVTKADSEVKTIADLKGKVVGVQNGSTAEKAISDAQSEETLTEVEVIGFADNLTAFLDLETSGIDAVLIDSVVARYFITTSGKDFVVMDEELSTEQYGIGFRKGDNALEQAVSQALLELAEEGVVAEISEKWFGEDVALIGK